MTIFKILRERTKFIFLCFPYKNGFRCFKRRKGVLWLLCPFFILYTVLFSEIGDGETNQLALDMEVGQCMDH